MSYVWKFEVMNVGLLLTRQVIVSSIFNCLCVLSVSVAIYDAFNTMLWGRVALIEVC